MACQVSNDAARHLVTSTPHALLTSTEYVTDEARTHHGGLVLVDHHFFSFRNYAGARDKTKNSKAAGTSVSSCVRALGVTGVNCQQGVQ